MSESSPHSSPMSPKPHLFGVPPDGTPRPPGRVLPSDLLTMDDYRRIRLQATKKSVLGGLVGGLGSAFAARQLYPKKLSPNALVLVGLSAGCASGAYASVSYLKSELGMWRAKADAMSTPTAEDGSPLLSDRASYEDRAAGFGETASLPSPPTSQSAHYTQDRGKWGSLGEGQHDQLRDPFFRPGVPRRDV